MKKTFLAVITALAVLLALTATAERKIWMYSHDGNHLSMDVTMLDSISFEEPGVLKLDPESKSLTATGGRFTVTVTTNKAWTARVSDATVLTLSAYRGTGNGTIYVNASSNADGKAYTATVTVTLDGGVSKYVYVTVAGTTPGPTPTDKVTDACGNTYPVVKIGEQYWMAENYRCSKYDTQSEAYNASWLTNNTVPTSVGIVYTPYYTDASDKSLWSLVFGDHSGNLTDAHVARFGYLYNWAAAVGVEDGYEYGTKTFTGNRQGICPNGWHIPAKSEWQILYDYIYSAQRLSSNEVGKYLKTTSGWYQNGNGSDTYGFAALPAGIMYESAVHNIGDDAVFWTATPRTRNSAYNSYLSYSHGSLNYYDSSNYTGHCVRCIMDSNTPAETLSASPSSKDIGVEGGQFQISINSNASWSVSSNKSWVVVSPSSGSGDGTVNVTVSENKYISSDVAIITVFTSKITATVSINRAGTPPSEKCKASDYPQVTIGTQTWMAENYRCSKYDTESEAYNASWLTNNTIPTANTKVYTPYYADASDNSKWDSDSRTILGINLTDAKIAKLGYLYNWAAAIGVVDGQKQTSAFSEKRQGICPNGWHVPSTAEWQTLEDYIEKTDGKGTQTAGKHLKTTSGWYSGNYSYKPGWDTYGFAALPAGGANGSAVYNIGEEAYFWTTSPYGKVSASGRTLMYIFDYLMDSEFANNSGKSVRCLMDNETPTPILDTLSITPTEKEVSYSGEQFTINVTSNTNWTATSDKSWVTMSKTSGNGDGTINVVVAENTSVMVDTALIKIETENGITAEVTIRRGVILYPEKCRASDYPQVTIGTQTWMAENYRCSKYDTQSEAYNAYWLTYNTIPISRESVYTPYYTDASDKSKWDSNSKTEYGVNLTNEQVAKLGYLYNWAAAVGVVDGQKQSTVFSGNRQGICPNGWHVPTEAEWQTLVDYIEKKDGKGTKTAGKHLKTTSGWYDQGNPSKYPQGLDTYGFAALPAYYANGSCVTIGKIASFWTASPYGKDGAYGRNLYFNDDYLVYGGVGMKYGGPVRCLRD